ncbi:alpha/beta fold hydrolase [Kutzneria albida]|uniref:alpha/beta fold hydrolase n=1 Tax=Kutzneria albida TaxID=43357 RepID=UPI00046D2DCC|nr:alpha/beta fold hydrolase [Kutzneria albida]
MNAVVEVPLSRGVLLVPGFGSGPGYFAPTDAWLRSCGYEPAHASIGRNLGCTDELVALVERQLVAHAEATGGPVVLLGHSRGGALARLVALRRPELVRGLVMLGSPVRDVLGANRFVVGLARGLTWLSAIGLRGLLTADCLTGSCFRTNSLALAAPLPPRLPALALYSLRDRIAPWRLCLDPYAECVAVRSSHTGLRAAPDVFAALESRLANWK